MRVIFWITKLHLWMLFQRSFYFLNMVASLTSSTWQYRRFMPMVFKVEAAKGRAGVTWKLGAKMRKNAEKII